MPGESEEGFVENGQAKNTREGVMQSPDCTSRAECLRGGLQTSESRIRFIRTALCVTILIAAVALLVWSVDLGALVKQCIGFLREAGPGPFFMAMAVLPVVGFPLSPFTFVAGPVFGPTMGVGTVIACAILATVVNVALSYWVAARALRPLMVRLLAWLGYALPVLSAGAGWEIVVLVRLVPGLPFFAQSFLLGIARVPFGSYLLVSTLVPAGYITATVLTGDALMHGDRRMLAVGGAVFVVVAAGLHRLRKRLAASSRRES